jgi:pyrroloquinoline quinone biosynthesis protein B
MKMKWIILIWFIIISSLNQNQVLGSEKQFEPQQNEDTIVADSYYIQILGIAQDAGYPQIACSKDCCKAVYQGVESRKNVVALALVNATTKQYWLFEATPDIAHQLQMVQDKLQLENMPLPQGIFITHAHMGHYTGLMQLGREALNATSIPVYCMPKMESFISNNGPWNQLVSLNNISIKPLQNNRKVTLETSILVEPMQVPHRDEFSETVGYLIQVNRKKILFIPDIDKWNKWDNDIITLIKGVDMAFLDGTFFKNGEIPYRDMAEIPHPFVAESIEKFKILSLEDRSKIYFIHFNHTNPLIKQFSSEKEMLMKEGFHIAEEGMVLPLY